MLMGGPEPPVLARQASLPQRFQGQVPASCRIDPAPSGTVLRMQAGRLLGETAGFQVTANAPVQLRLGRITKLAWPAEAAGAARAEPIATLVGSGPYRIQLELIPPPGELLPAGTYRVAVSLDCILATA